VIGAGKMIRLLCLTGGWPLDIKNGKEQGRIQQIFQRRYDSLSCADRKLAVYIFTRE